MLLFSHPAVFGWVRVGQEVAEWNHLFHELRRYREEFGGAGPPFKWRDPVADFGNSLARWYHSQPDLFRQRLLLPDQARAGPCRARLWRTCGRAPRRIPF